MADAPGPGIYESVPDADYRAWPYPSYSTLSLFRDPDLCELEIRYLLEHPQEQTDEMRLGSLVERAIDGEDLLGNVRQLPEGIKARAGQKYKDLCRLNPGIEYLPHREFEKRTAMVQQARDMAASIQADPWCSEMLARSRRQVSVVADLKFPGASGDLVTHRVKGRLDYLQLGKSAAMISDLKCLSAGGPRKVGAHMYEYALDIQCAVYIDLLAAVQGWSGEDPQRIYFFFAVCRSKAPYVVTKYNGRNSTEMANAVYLYGRNSYQVILERLRECHTTGQWNGYRSFDAPEQDVLDIQWPSYAL